MTNIASSQTDDCLIGTLVLVDDNQIDHMIYRRIAERSKLVRDIRSFYYAEEALDFLRQPDRPEVDVVLLDINMPRMNGFDFLQSATEELGESFAKLVVVMLTTSLDAADQTRAAGYQAVKGYFNKPLTVEHIQELVELLGAIEH